MTPQRQWLCAFAMLICACAPVPVDLEAVPIAKASCEEPTPDLLLPDENMLPGRVCQQCHTRGGQGYRFKWTASGTIFDTITSPCNGGGVEGVTIEIYDMMDRLQSTMVSNTKGNFWTTDPITFPIRTRIMKGDIVREMRTPAAMGSCASCHQTKPQNGAPGPMYLNL
jgi:hypothetical protein